MFAFRCPNLTGTPSWNFKVMNTAQFYQPKCKYCHMHRHTYMFYVLLQENSIFRISCATFDLPYIKVGLRDVGFGGGGGGFDSYGLG
jgi:hypothetical protein